jgi:hypothetical protein
VLCVVDGRGGGSWLACPKIHVDPIFIYIYRLWLTVLVRTSVGGLALVLTGLITYQYALAYYYNFNHLRSNTACFVYYKTRPLPWNGNALAYFKIELVLTFMAIKFQHSN